MNKTLRKILLTAALTVSLLIALVSCMPAAGESAGQMDFLMPVAMIGILIGLFFFMGRGGKKRAKQEEKMRNEIGVDDEITTIGGVVGRVVSVSEKTLVIETTRDKTRIRVMKWAVKTVDVKASDPVPDEESGSEAADEAAPAPAADEPRGKKLKD